MYAATGGIFIEEAKAILFPQVFPEENPIPFGWGAGSSVWSNGIPFIDAEGIFI